MCLPSSGCFSFIHKMNAKQKAVRGLGILMLALCALFPPWKLSYHVGVEGTKEVGAKVSSSAGYHPVWNPPHQVIETDANQTSLNYHIDMVRIVIELAALLIFINVGVYLLKDRSE